MKFEKLTSKKIRIVFTLDDMILNNISAQDFLNDKSLSQKVLHSILSAAEKEIGFKTDDCKLLVEAIASSDGGLVFTITKVFNDIDINNNLNSFKNLIFEFETIDDFLDLCTCLKHMNINNLKAWSKSVSLVFYNNTYYLLVLNTNNLFYSLHLILSEFGKSVKYSSKFEGVLNEYGEVVFNKNAIFRLVNQV